MVRYICYVALQEVVALILQELHDAIVFGFTVFQSPVLFFTQVGYHLCSSEDNINTAIKTVLPTFFHTIRKYFRVSNYLIIRNVIYSTEGYGKF